MMVGLKQSPSVTWMASTWWVFFSFCWTCDFDCGFCCCYFSVFVFLCFFNGVAKSGRSKSILRYYTTTNIEVKTIPSTDEQMMNLTNSAFDISTLSSFRLNFFVLKSLLEFNLKLVLAFRILGTVVVVNGRKHSLLGWKMPRATIGLITTLLTVFEHAFVADWWKEPWLDRTKDMAIKQYFLTEPCNSQIRCFSVPLSCICPLKLDEFDKICCCVEQQSQV